jgi:flagellar protein FlaF
VKPSNKSTASASQKWNTAVKLREVLIMKMSVTKSCRKIGKTTDSQQEIEAGVLTQGAIKLRQCLENWECKDIRFRINEALLYNRRIWCIFHSELEKTENHLPEDLRRNLLSLSIFVDKQIFRGMAYPSYEILNSIININTGIAEGLRMSSDNKKATMSA